MNLNIAKILRWGCLAFIFYLLACCLFPPLLRTKSAAFSSSSALLADSLSAVSSSDEFSGQERILCIDDNLDALLWRLRVIESAQDELILSTFNFCDDNSGLDIMSALKSAADRGVQIKILVDGLYGLLELENSSHFQSLISLPAVEAKLYNPIRLGEAWTGNYRLHDKYLIADESVYIMGGRNIGDLFLGNYEQNANIDRDVLVCEAPSSVISSEYSDTGGGSAPNSLMQLKEYFHSIWNLDSNKLLSCDQSSKKTTTAILALDSHYETLKTSYPEAFETADWTSSTLPTERITLYTNPIEPENKLPTLWNSLCVLMSESQEAIVQTPYIMCDDLMYSGLSAVAGSGTRVTLLTNAVETGANPWGCSDYQNQKKNILQTGVTICEYPGASSVHTKTLLLDDNVSIIGSYNMDIRSTYLDTEMMLVIDCPELNQSLKQQTAEMMTQSRIIHSDGTVEYGENYIEPEYSLFKRCLYTVIRIACPLIRHVL